ncbi:Response regulator receiver domain-containing protein [Bryocella elongata]|uniref:Response regulator receiver domain-containing protein n=1 Tax=Bryocella elongata TaxID=863522 RepID=A0A1H6AVE2_9BACT|nr:response regulator [Bryocella elongata]SEG52244.1 Response regulator receiver domain-containing protein [Bryocella elongata]
MPTVLLVEDNEWNRDMLSRRLARCGWLVLTAEDGPAGLELAQNHAFDLVLMDMSLPGMDGWTVTERMKADDRTAGIPIIALTAHVMNGDRERAFAVGCDDFEAKPIEFSVLLAKMSRLVNRCPPA